MALRSQKRAHGLRRDLRTTAARAALEPVEAEELEKKSNELAWLTPVVFADDDFEDVSAWRASIADAAAPRASNMA
jgi:hypothetical protein